MSSNQISELYYTGDDSLQISDIKLYGNSLVVSCFTHIIEEYRLETYVVIIDKATGNEIFKKYLGRASEGPHSCYLEGDVIYSAVDRTMMAIDVKTGERLDYIVCPEKGFSDFWGPYPTIYDDKLYIIRKQDPNEIRSSCPRCQA